MSESNGKLEIHYTSIYKKISSWSRDGSLTKVFEASVKHLSEENMLDISVLNGDGSVRYLTFHHCFCEQKQMYFTTR